jgi:hypothetical protein
MSSIRSDLAKPGEEGARSASFAPTDTLIADPADRVRVGHR